MPHATLRIIMMLGGLFVLVAGCNESLETTRHSSLVFPQITVGCLAVILSLRGFRKPTKEALFTASFWVIVIGGTLGTVFGIQSCDKRAERRNLEAEEAERQEREESRAHSEAEWTALKNRPVATQPAQMQTVAGNLWVGTRLYHKYTKQFFGTVLTIDGDSVEVVTADTAQVKGDTLSVASVHFRRSYIIQNFVAPPGRPQVP